MKFKLRDCQVDAGLTRLLPVIVASPTTRVGEEQDTMVSATFTVALDIVSNSSIALNRAGK